MNVSIFEIGNFYDAADIRRAFSSEESAIKKIPPGFKRVDVLAAHELYYENDIDEKWLTIQTYEVEE